MKTDGRPIVGFLVLFILPLLFAFACSGQTWPEGSGYVGEPVFPGGGEDLDGDEDADVDDETETAREEEGETEAESDACVPNPCNQSHRTTCVPDAEEAFRCLCDQDFQDYGDGECRPSDPCAEDTECAAAHRMCENNAGQPACGDCAAGYHEDGGNCGEDTGCQETTCSGHGDCDDSSGAPVCDCQSAWEGDHCETCIVPASWPPEAPWWNGKVCNLPACSRETAICFDQAGTWRRTLTTTYSNCNPSMASFDARVTPGNVDVSTYELGLVGECDYKGDVQEVITGVVHGDIMIICDVNPQQMGVTSVETSTIAFEGDGGTGTAKVFLYDVPIFGDCYIDFSVLMERQ
ncbi:MAG: hypothetical protein C4523_09810 [Myxococcales bacterium]|nr:MAG: hypothetical protein C4523_09810 [Myxococcales bacterium]